jgi:hypothetical protein
MPSLSKTRTLQFFPKLRGTKVTRVIFIFGVLAIFGGCSKKESQTHLSDEEFLRLVQPGPAPGRAEFVSPVALIPDPARYHGKRIILSGIWRTGFELSVLDLENKAQGFWIWVDADWKRIDETNGDLSSRKERGDEAKPDSNGHTSHRILAEGSFYFRKQDSKTSAPGFGHMNASEGYFLIDRLFRFAPYENETRN